MVDFFLVLLLPAGGDELQGIKKGIIELADAMVVNKADGDLKDAAERTRGEYAGALELIRPTTPSWTPRAMTASAKQGDGIAEVWAMVLEHRALLTESGELQAKRREQGRAWMWRLVEEGLRRRLREHPAVAALIPELERRVQALEATPAAAARELLEVFRQS
jgi:LAO/AO transport system kinase